MKTFQASEKQRPTLQVTPTVDRFGKITFIVNYQKNDGSFDRVGFSKMTSVVDFIDTNF